MKTQGAIVTYLTSGVGKTLRNVVLAILCAMVAAPANAADTARYRLEASFFWEIAPDAADRPSDLHFTPLIGATHNGRYSLFVDGDTASSGLALVAINGRASVLMAEMAEASRRGRVDTVFEGAGVKGGVGEVSVEFAVEEDRPLVSFATMVAPSPDWFTGVSGVPLRRDGQWLERVEAPLWVWDAGADAGETFEAPNQPMQPRQSVRLVAGPQFLSEAGLFPIGRAVFVLISE